MKIQRFANVWDEQIAGYNNEINKLNNQISQQEAEKNQLISDYNKNYDQTLLDYNALQEQQKNQIDTWAETQKETQQKQTDYNIGLINQQKEEAAKQTAAEQGNAYVDYQKGLNQYGGTAEQLASQGLGGTGFAKNQEIAMNITYQNRVSAANTALQNANKEYQNQITQALLTNDAKLAEIAYQQLAEQTALALQGFEYRQDMYNKKLSYEQGINDSYFNRINTYRNMIQNYQSNIASANAQKVANEQWERQFAESQRQYNNTMAYNYSKSGGDSGGFSSSPEVSTAYYQGSLNADAKTYGTFSNGYQPKGISGHGTLSKTGDTLQFKTQTLSGQNQTVTQNIWKAKDGTKWYWDGRYNKYIQIS